MTEIKMIARPWTPQDLLDDLQDMIKEESDNYLNTRRTTLEMARAYLKEHFYGWIPVSERLPEIEQYDYSVDVLCYVPNDHIHIGYISFKTGKWRCFGLAELLDECEVTHWMPLPEMPKGEDKDGL